jgi:hypothetical protein
MARSLKDVNLKHRTRTLADIRLIRGFNRAAHFAAGGTLEAWRGRSDIRPDKRKDSNRRACRGPVQDD